MNTDRYSHLLSRVEKPGRYTGNEYGETQKNLDEVDTRMCFCFPDTYEIGMSNLGMKTSNCKASSSMAITQPGR